MSETPHNCYARQGIIDTVREMEVRLAAKDQERGQYGWEDDDDDGLFQHLIDEVLELHRALISGKAHAIVAEAADVANLAAMLGDPHRLSLTDRNCHIPPDDPSATR